MGGTCGGFCELNVERATVSGRGEWQALSPVCPVKSFERTQLAPRHERTSEIGKSALAEFRWPSAMAVVHGTQRCGSAASLLLARGVTEAVKRVRL
jgi:hypothetical protein